MPGRSDATTRSRAVQELGIRAFEAVDGRGLARVDFFLAADELYVNELNTMPGFTPISMFPKCWIASGMTYGELISELIDTALERADGLSAGGASSSVHTEPSVGSSADDARQRVEHLGARDDLVVEVDLDRGRAAERRHAVARCVGVVDDPVDAVHRSGRGASSVRAARHRTMSRTAAGSPHAPVACASVQRRAWPSTLAGQPHGDLGAGRIVRVSARLERHGRGAAGEAATRGDAGDRDGEAAARSGHPSRLPAACWAIATASLGE